MFIASIRSSKGGSKETIATDANWKLFPHQSMDKQQQQRRSASSASTTAESSSAAASPPISTGGQIKELLLSPIAACRSPSSEINIVTPPSTPQMQGYEVPAKASVIEEKRQHETNNRGRKKEAVYRYRSAPPLYNNKKGVPRTQSSPSLSSSHEVSPVGNGVDALSSSSFDQCLDKAACDDCCTFNWGDTESSYSYSSRDHLLNKKNKNGKDDKKAASSPIRKPQQQKEQMPSYSSYDCNYNHSQEQAYEEFGVERKLIDKHPQVKQSSKSNRKKKQWIKLKRAASTNSTLPPKPSISCLKRAISLGSYYPSSPLPPSGKPSKKGKSTQKESASPPSATCFNVNIKKGHHTLNGDYSSSATASVSGYYSAPIETELCSRDRSLSQMGMEVREDDYCIEGEYMAMQLPPHPHQSQRLSGRRGASSIKDLAPKTRSKSCSPKVLKTKVLSAFRGGNNTTKDASGKKKIPNQIAIGVTPSTSEDTAEDQLSIDEMTMLYKWQQARCRNAVPSLNTTCNKDGSVQIETAIAPKKSEDALSITEKSVGDSTVLADNRQCSLRRRQVSF